jgi:hypothetical protein
MIKIDQSPAIHAGISFPLVTEIILKSHFFHFFEIIGNLPPVIEFRVSGMRIPQLREMDLTCKLFAIHAKIDLLLFISTDTDTATPFTATLLFAIFRCTSQAGFLIGRAGATPNPTGGQFSRNLSFQVQGLRMIKITHNLSSIPLLIHVLEYS